MPSCVSQSLRFPLLGAPLTREEKLIVAMTVPSAVLAPVTYALTESVPPA
jgi:hypothetical protein